MVLYDKCININVNLWIVRKLVKIMTCERLNELKIKESFNSKRLKELESRINKAIKYIENDLALTDGFAIYEDGAKELLNILGGDVKGEEIK